MKKLWTIHFLVVLSATLVLNTGCSKTPKTVKTTASANTLEQALYGSGSKIWVANSCYNTIFVFDSAIVFNKDHTYTPLPIKNKVVHSYNRKWTATTDDMIIAQYNDSALSDRVITDTFYISGYTASKISFDTIKNKWFRYSGCLPEWENK